MSFINVDLPRFYHFFCVEVEKPIQETSYGLVFFFFLVGILSFPKWLERNPEAKKFVQATVDCYLQLQTANGNFPCAMDEVDNVRPAQDELVHWCHGAPGKLGGFLLRLQSKCQLYPPSLKARTNFPDCKKKNSTSAASAICKVL